MHRARLASTILAVSLLASTVRAQTADSLTRDSVMTDSAIAARSGYRRSTQTATLLGAIVPGAGHLYAGEWLKTYPIFVGTVGGILVGAVVFDWDRCTFNWSGNCRPGVPIGARIYGGAMVAGSLVMWARSAVDAGHAVERQREHRARAERIRRAARATVAPCPLAPQAWCIGMSVGGQE